MCFFYENMFLLMKQFFFGQNMFFNENLFLVKKMFLGENMWFSRWKSVFGKNVFLVKHIFGEKMFWWNMLFTENIFLVTKINTTISKIVFLKPKISFPILSSILSRRSCKLRRRLRNAKIDPLEIQISDFFFQISIIISRIIFFVLNLRFLKRIALVFFLKMDWGYTFLKA